jgi:hypothetical protein
MSHTASYSVVLDRPAADVWDVVRDFNSYPIWVDGVDDSHIEDGLSGTSVGCVRNFAMGEIRTRQRLLAHSDAERFFSYESCRPTELDDSGTVRTMSHYVGTIHLRPITEGDRCFVEWSSRYDCADQDADFWADWWSTSLPTWLGSLRIT